MRHVLRGSTVTSRTVLLAAVSGLLAVAYAVPGLGIARIAAPPGRRSIITYLENLGPVWASAFGAVTLLLLWGLISDRLLEVWHASGAAVSGGYSVALWFGALASRPVGTVVAATLSLLMFALHVWSALDYARSR